MTLTEYVEQEKKTLDMFKERYEQGMKENPDDFPSTMNVTEWFDRFVDFSEYYV